MVGGGSLTSEMKKIDAPYIFFKRIQRICTSLLSLMPMVGLEGGTNQYRADGFRG